MTQYTYNGAFGFCQVFRTRTTYIIGSSSEGFCIHCINLVESQPFQIDVFQQRPTLSNRLHFRNAFYLHFCCLVIFIGQQYSQIVDGGRQYWYYDIYILVFRQIQSSHFGYNRLACFKRLTIVEVLAIFLAIVTGSFDSGSTQLLLQDELLVL